MSSVNADVPTMAYDRRCRTPFGDVSVPFGKLYARRRAEQMARPERTAAPCMRSVIA
jgi:hypothetical protein